MGFQTSGPTRAGLIDEIRRLMILSLLNPADAARQLIAMRLPMRVRWLGLGLVAVLATLFIGTTGYIEPRDDLNGIGAAMGAPLPGFAIQAGTILILALLVTFVGQLFGGKGSFADALLLSVWLEFLTLLPTVLQLVLLFVLPMATIPIALFVLVAFVWILLVFIQTLHGFTRVWPVAMGLIGTLIGVSMILGIVLVSLGFDPAAGGAL